MKRTIVFLILAVFSSSCDRATVVEILETRINFNGGWEFIRDIDEELTDDFFRRSGHTVTGWETIRLPHTAHLEPLVITDQQWQGTAVYRKSFYVDRQKQGKHIAIRFEGVMHETHVYLNGEHIYTNYGGYLPFVIDLTDKLRYGEENILLLTVNNEDNPEIPPGKPIAELDFNYYSGIYRNVILFVKDKLRISDPILADRIAAGGVFVSYENVSPQQATVRVQTDVQNDYDTVRHATVRYFLQDKNGIIVATKTSEEQSIEPRSYRLFDLRLHVSNPRLWSPADPYLYTLTVQLLEGDRLIDTEQLRIGIRTFTIDGNNGFVLNGERIYVRGTNRHQEYPYIGYALSDNAQYRDAYKIKRAGFNFIRTGHYPPSTAFLEACDELGILFMNAIPGWQFFGNETFQERSFRDIRTMIRRDRNHPSIIMWEASLNETEMTREFMDRAHAIVYEELPIRDVYTSGWIDYAYDVFIPARQHSRPPDYWSNYGTHKPLFIAEYGDWEYYAHNAGFQQDAFEDLLPEERNSRQLRGDGQRRLAQQALNFQEAHNSNLYSPAFGDANWVMYDYNRGYATDLCAAGIMDIFRIPKFAYYFYQSQASPDASPTAEFSTPMVFIANYWSDPSFLEIKVYSNTDEVALYLNDQFVERRQPDRDRISTNLQYPPFTFNLDSFEAGVLRAVGYINGTPVAEHYRRTPYEPTSIALDIDMSNRVPQAGANDVLFVYASIVDKNGTVVPHAVNPVTFYVEGDGELIGENPKNAEAGIASILLRIGDIGGEIVLRAKAENLESAVKKVSVE